MLCTIVCVVKRRIANSPSFCCVHIRKVLGKIYFSFELLFGVACPLFEVNQDSVIAMF